MYTTLAATPLPRPHLPLAAVVPIIPSRHLPPFTDKLPSPSHPFISAFSQLLVLLISLGLSLEQLRLSQHHRPTVPDLPSSSPAARQLLLSSSNRRLSSSSVWLSQAVLPPLTLCSFKPHQRQWQVSTMENIGRSYEDD
ncbi:hypothetical protein PIB30_065418 [Stylosanthes scabra]|uniref:Uncharacterized protein n=1 Tax=Stylosanthes scabra TaxID=79078 RepID=A0ABU6ZKT3_9FABA|nr:hypothetical protein [Stylosanthes scabra]